jgi:hypothetical protein
LDGKLCGDVATEAGSLLHHLLNQSLSALDFCILWQDLDLSEPGLNEVESLVAEFVESADLTALDRALALLPEPTGSRPEPLAVRSPHFHNRWAVSSSRIRNISRADFRCTLCGFEITLSQEHDPNTEMRLPYDNFQCPFCVDQPTIHQGSKTPQTNSKL